MIHHEKYKCFNNGCKLVVYVTSKTIWALRRDNLEHLQPPVGFKKGNMETIVIPF